MFRIVVLFFLFLFTIASRKQKKKPVETARSVLFENNIERQRTVLNEKWNLLETIVLELE